MQPFIQYVEFNNPITENKDYIKLKYPNVDYFKFKHTREYKTDNDLINILKDILKDLNCTIEYKEFRLKATFTPIYDMQLSEYYFYLIRINNQFLYNKYLDKLIKRHIDNIVFEYKNPYYTPRNKSKSSRKKEKDKKGDYIRYTTRDVFTNKETYIYYNTKTKEEIESDNYNLLEELNKPKKKTKNKVTKTKYTGVPISAMTFSFKKKVKQ